MRHRRRLRHPRGPAHLRPAHLRFRPPAAPPLSACNPPRETRLAKKCWRWPRPAPPGLAALSPGGAGRVTQARWARAPSLHLVLAGDKAAPDAGSGGSGGGGAPGAAGSFIGVSIHSLLVCSNCRCLLGASWVPGPVRGFTETAVNKAKVLRCPQGVGRRSGGEPTNK